MITEIRFEPNPAHGRTPRPLLLEWLADEGERVESGEPLCLYESDKATAECRSPVAGYVRRHLLSPGARFSRGTLLALVADAPDEPLPAGYSPEPATDADASDAFDWSEIDNRGGEPEPPGLMRRAIADRMAMSKRHIPCFYLTATADMSGCAALRASLKKAGRKATFNDMAIKASALALTRHPKAAAVYTPEGLVPRTELNIGFAAALPDDGLVVPVVKRADTLSLTAIADETRRLAAKAKGGTLSPGDCNGGVFSVSYLGGSDVDNFVAIVNPGEAAILAMGKTADAPVAIDGELAIRPIVKLTLSCDHRSIDGALAARLMTDIKWFLEHPEEL